jgi:hypothetical protein
MGWTHTGWALTLSALASPMTEANVLSMIIFILYA